MRTGRFLIKRLIYIIFVFFIISILMFAIYKSLPGDPVRMMLGESATPEAQAMAASWYQNGTEVVFGCGGAVGNSVMAAAEEAGAKFVGVDVDQSPESETVITSAMKELSNSVYEGVKQFYAGSFPGGSTSVFTAENDGVGLPMDTSKFETFSQADYDALFAKLSGGEITIQNGTEDSTTADLTLAKTKVNFVE